ncbi:MAG: hypothetical protein BWY20_02472 [Spirochaetes bacterium ADurb.Bin215]|nr:MAG: hypothetical protein BWY20_02472 [Spirochaetes bacterium ADurb.Bin215]
MTGLSVDWSTYSVSGMEITAVFPARSRNTAVTGRFAGTSMDDVFTLIVRLSTGVETVISGCVTIVPIVYASESSWSLSVMDKVTSTVPFIVYVPVPASYE